MTANLLLKHLYVFLAYSYLTCHYSCLQFRMLCGPTGKLSISTPALVTYISSVYKVPVLVTLNLNLDSVVE